MVGANGADAEEEPPSSQAPKKRSRWGAREDPVVDGTAAAAGEGTKKNRQAVGAGGFLDWRGNV